MVTTARTESARATIYGKRPMVYSQREIAALLKRDKVSLRYHSDQTVRAATVETDSQLELVSQLHSVVELKISGLGEGVSEDAAVTCLRRMKELQIFTIVKLTLGEAWFAALQSLTKLEELYCTAEDGDQALQYLATMPHLISLHLRAPQVGAQGTEALGQCRHLQKLGLSCTTLGASLADVFTSLTGLVELSVYGTPMGDADCISFPHLTRLRELMLSETLVSDDCLKYLGGLEHLESLGLDDTQIQGAGLSELKQLPHLRWMSLNRTRVDDSLAEVLSGMDALRELWLYGSAISPAGVRRLRKTLPHCRVYSDYDEEEALVVRDSAWTLEGLARRVKRLLWSDGMRL